MSTGPIIVEVIIQASKFKGIFNRTLILGHEIYLIFYKIVEVFIEESGVALEGGLA